MAGDFEKTAKELLGSKNSASIMSKSDDIKKLALSSDGQKVMRMMGDTDKLKTAFENGDTQTLQNVLSNVMSTKEGARLVKQLSDLIK